MPWGHTHSCLQVWSPPFYPLPPHQSCHSSNSQQLEMSSTSASIFGKTPSPPETLGPTAMSPQLPGAPTPLLAAAGG